jgi:hypothetical protein
MSVSLRFDRDALSPSVFKRLRSGGEARPCRAHGWRASSGISVMMIFEKSMPPEDDVGHRVVQTCQKLAPVQLPVDPSHRTGGDFLGMLTT